MNYVLKAFEPLQFFFASSQKQRFSFTSVLGAIIIIHYYLIFCFSLLFIALKYNAYTSCNSTEARSVGSISKIKL